jgi:hypothetical protein
MAVSAMLVTGLASAVFLATQSLDSATSPTATAIATGEALDRLNAELRLATKFTERTATAVTFTVPDQNGDGVPDTIRYAWAGAGTPLMRTFNGLPSPAASVLDNVQAFNMNFLTRTMQPAIVETAEQVLCAYAPGSPPTTVPVSKTSWGAQYFKPTLPANTISWKITRIRLMVMQGSVTGLVKFPITNVDATQKPTGGALATYQVNSNTLPSGSLGWVEIPYSGLTCLDPAKGYAFEVTATSASTVANVGFQSGISPALTGMSNCSSTDQGASWSSPAATRSLFFQVYGTITTQGPLP